MRRRFWQVLLLVNMAGLLSCVAAMVVHQDVSVWSAVGVALGVLGGLGCRLELRDLSAPLSTLTVADRIAPGTVVSVSGSDLMVVVSCTGNGPFTLGVRRQR